MTPKRRILVVDDEESIRDLVKESLTDEGCDVTVAASFEEGWIAATGSPFDLLITDYNLGPGEDGKTRTGLELAFELAQQKSLPAIIMSGRIKEIEDILASIQDNWPGELPSLLGKPIGLDELLNSVLLLLPE